MSKEKDISAHEFISSVLATLEKYQDIYHDSLENYLLALWTLLRRNKNLTPSYSLFSGIIGEAFETPPSAFDEDWLAYNEGTIWKYQDGSDRIEEYKGGEWKLLSISDFELLQHTILFQIADLHRIPPEQLKDPHSYFGIRSPSGASWYNLDVFTFWECAMAGMEVRVAHDWQGPEYFVKCNWAVLAELLTLGQLYE